MEEKLAFYNKANREVAILCNHQKSVSKNFDQQMARMQEKVAPVGIIRATVCSTPRCAGGRAQGTAQDVQEASGLSGGQVFEESGADDQEEEEVRRWLLLRAFVCDAYRVRRAKKAKSADEPGTAAEHDADEEEEEEVVIELPSSTDAVERKIAKLAEQIRKAEFQMQEKVSFNYHIFSNLI